MASYIVNPHAVARAEKRFRHKQIELAAHDLLYLLDRTCA